MSDSKVTPNVSEKQDKRSKIKSSKQEKTKLAKKIIIRNLPPSMAEKDFLQQVDPLPDYELYYYCQADWSLGHEATCRAYVTFKNADDIFLFRDRFDGYVFVDSKGGEYVAIVEYAPFQGTSKKKARNNDNKMGTIEMEEHYQHFLKMLEDSKEYSSKLSGDIKNEFTLDRKNDETIINTPLLQYLSLKKEKRREENKKRTEEKRKLREEKQPPLTVAKTVSESGIGDIKDPNLKSAKIPSNKNSRSKRRAERDQKRREEYEKRKKIREQQPQNSTNKLDNKQIKIQATEQILKDDNKKCSHNTDNIDISANNSKKLSIKKADKKETEQKSEKAIRSLKSFVENKQSVHKIQRSSEEGRIRNKDRPSIAIYQPRGRLQLEENETTDVQKDLLSENDGKSKDITRTENFLDQLNDCCSKTKNSNDDLPQTYNSRNTRSRDSI